MLVLPSSQQRLVIIGPTGSGKTQAGAFYLSRAAFDVMPFVIVNTKGDELLDEIGSREIDLDDVPKKPGLYTIRPLPHEEDEFNAFLWKVHQRGKCGLYFDEGYMIPKGSAPFRAILTQGRSKRIPAIILSQRPVWMDRFVWSEAEYINVFPLRNSQDIATVQQMIPIPLEPEFDRMPEFYSIWRDVPRNRVLVVKPVPSRESILSDFAARTKTRKVYL